MRLCNKKSCFSYLVSLGCLLLGGLDASKGPLGEYTEYAVPVKLEDGVSCLVSDEEVASSTINSNTSWLLNKLIIKLQKSSVTSRPVPTHFDQLSF